MLFQPLSERRQLILAAIPFTATLGLCTHRSLALKVGELAPNSGVLGEVAQMAVHRLLVSLERLFLAAYFAGEIDDRSVGLELGEGGFQDVTRALAAELFDQVHRHVVCRREA